MRKRGKKYIAAVKQVDQTKEYPIPEAVVLLKKAGYAKFDESIDVSIHLGVDPKYADQMVRGTVVLPHGIGKSVHVLVIASGEKVREAEEAGADFTGGMDIIEKIKSGWTDFDTMIATPDMMKEVGKLGKILGPKGLMPNPKTGTVTLDITQAVKEAKAGKIEFRVDKLGVVHCIVGKRSFEDGFLVNNFNTLMDAIIRAKPQSLKGRYLKSVVLSSSMGPGIPVAVTTA